MGKSALIFAYEPPQFAKRCRIKIDFNTHECTVVLNNVDENDLGEWKLELVKEDYETIEITTLFEETIFLFPSNTSPSLMAAYGCGLEPSARSTNFTSQFGYRMNNRPDELHKRKKL